MRDLYKIHAVSALLLAGIQSGDLFGGPHKEPPPKLPCLNCGKEKQHNNAYCSAECCKEHRAKKKGASDD